MSISRNPNWKHIFTSDLGQVGGFCSGTPFYSIKKTDCLDITEILLKVALNTTTFILTPPSPNFLWLLPFYEDSVKSLIQQKL
jgi:hypothetical protein